MFSSGVPDTPIYRILIVFIFSNIKRFLVVFETLEFPVDLHQREKLLLEGHIIIAEFLIQKHDRGKWSSLVLLWFETYEYFN